MLLRFLLVYLLFAFPTEWERFESKECNFSIKFPGEVGKRIFSSTPLKYPHYAFFAYRDRETYSYYYSVYCIDLGTNIDDRENLEEILDSDIRRGVEDKIENFERLTFLGYSARRTTAPVRETTANSDSLVIQRLLFYAGRFSYDLSVSERIDQIDNVEKFLNSFQLFE